MKTQFFKTSLIMLGLVFGLMTTSCSDEDDGGGSGGNAAPGTVKANVDGSNFVSDPIVIDSVTFARCFCQERQWSLLRR